MIKPRIGPFLILAGLVLVMVPYLTALASVEYIDIQTSSPVLERQVCSIDVSIKTGVGVSGIANLFIDEVFLQSIGGTGGSDGIMYFSTGWTAIGVGDHVLRISYFEDGYPTQPFDASTVITVLKSNLPPINNPPPINNEPEQNNLGLYMTVLGFGTAAIGTVVTAVEVKKLKLP